MHDDTQSGDAVPHEADRGVHRRWYSSRRDDGIAELVVQTVADVTRTEPLDMRPLYEVVDPDALEEFIGTDPGEPSGGPDGEGSTGGRDRRVTFEYQGCAVTVCGDGLTTVAPSDFDGS